MLIEFTFMEFSAGINPFFSPVAGPHFIIIIAHVNFSKSIDFPFLSLFLYCSAGAETITDITNAAININHNNHSNSNNNNLNVIGDATINVSNAFEIIAYDNGNPATGTDASANVHKHISSVTQAISGTHAIAVATAAAVGGAAGEDGVDGAGLGGDTVAIKPSKGSAIASTATYLSDELALAGHSELVASSSLNIRRDIATTVAHTPPITTNRPCEYPLYSYPTTKQYILCMLHARGCDCTFPISHFEITSRTCRE